MMPPDVYRSVCLLGFSKVDQFVMLGYTEASALERPGVSIIAI